MPDIETITEDVDEDLGLSDSFFQEQLDGDGFVTEFPGECSFRAGDYTSFQAPQSRAENYRQ